MTPVNRPLRSQFTRLALLGLLLATVSLALFSLTPRRASATASPHDVSASASLTTQLNADGTLKATRGSFDASGYRMELAANGAPRFVPVTAAAATCDENWDGQFYAPGPVGQVNAVAISATGEVYIGGTFTLVGTVSANRIAKWNGSAWSALGSGLNSDVLALAVSGNDVYAGGTFTTAGGANIKGVAKWNGSTWSALGTGLSSGFNPNVSAIAVSGNNVYVGGVFSTAGGVTVNNAAVWNGSAWSALGTGTNGRVFALALNGTELYAGGEFTAAGGVTVNRVARWDGSAWSALGTGASATVYALTFYNGELVAGGGFTSIGGISASRLARWNGSAWAALGSGLGTNLSDSLKVRALAVRGGNLVAGGSFVTAGGVTVNNIAEWNGTSWAALGNGVASSIEFGVVAVYALAATGGDLYVGGDFRSVGGPNVSNLAHWNGSAWSALGGGGNAIMTSHGGGSLPPYLSAVAVHGNDVYVGGQFLAAGGVIANNIVKWNGTQWSALGNGITGGAGTEVRAIAVSANGDVYAGGTFAITIGGATTRGIAKWNGTSWVALSGGVIGGQGKVQAIVINGNDVYVGGNFTSACNGVCTNGAGDLPVNGIAKWNGSTWSALGSGIGGSHRFVLALALSGNNLYLGGKFDTAGGVTANGIAKWDGSAWSALGSGIAPSLALGSVNALAVRGNELFVGGNFPSAGGAPAASIAKWNESTSTWSALGSGITGSGQTVSALAVSGNSIYATGDFTNAGGLTGVNHLARWDAVTNAWSAVGSGLGSGFNSSPSGKALVAASGQLYLGGNFTTAGGQQSQFLARYTEGTAVINTQPANQTACLGQPATFTIGVTGSNGTLSYQWRKNGVNIAGATSSSYTTPVVTAADNGALYDVVVVNSCGASVISAAATLSVNNQPTITASPVSTIVCASDAAIFSVAATGATNYQWRKNGTPISGATASTLSLSNVQAGDAGAYDVVVSNACGMVSSAAATLSVNAATAITTQPTTQTACVGAAATFNVAATGTGLSYQWRKSGVSIAGATSNSFSIASVTLADAGSYDVIVTGACNTLTSTAATLTVNAATAISTQPVSQAKIVGQSVSFSVAATGTGLSYQWRKDGAPISGATASSYAISLVTLADAGNYDVVVSGACGNATSSVAVLTVTCPTLTLSPSTIPQGQVNVAYPTQTFSASGGNAPYTFSLSGALPTGISFSNGVLTGTPTAQGNFPLTITATDNYGCATSSNLTLTVVNSNRPPVAVCQNITVTADATCTAFADINNGSSDPDGDTLTFTQTPAGPYAVGTHTVTLTVNDGRGGTSSCTATVTVNAPKPVPAITGPTSGSIYQVGIPITFTGTFTDVAGTTHTADWKFESATPPAITATGTVTEPAGATPGTASVMQSFTTPGVYLVTLTVTNNCGGTEQATTIGADQFSALVVIYDPGAGFVTGGGWINSPAGAYVDNPLLTGKANFGFVSKYQNGNSVPTGNTEFQFKAGNLNFKSTVYEWLVVAGARAQYKGSGKINGAGDYRFMLTAIDGQEPGGGGQDKFRLRIWNNVSGGLVYDNQMNAPDNADPTTVLGGGSIVIHK